MTPLVLFSSALIGVVLGGLGGGGAVLALPILLYLAREPPREAIATSLLVVGATSAVGALRKWRLGEVRLKQGLTFAAGGMLGALAGARIAAHVEPRALLVAFAALMLVSAGLMLRPARPQTSRVRPWLVVPVGLASGLITGAVGAGGGFIVIPALVLVLGVPMREAAGTSLLVIALQSLAGAAGQLGHVHVDPLLSAGMAASASAGVLLGTAVATRLPVVALRRALAGLMAVAAAYLLASPPRAEPPKPTGCAQPGPVKKGAACAPLHHG